MTYNITPPKSQICAILAHLITRSGVSERELPFNGFRTRLSELRREHGLSIQVRDVEFTNQFGRDSRYHFHYLLDQDKEGAVELYKKLNG